jgi:DNA-directed RNA polymerase specialized sigma24 family protein
MTRRYELDSHLLQLAKTAQQYPPRSWERQIALTKLVNAIVDSGNLWRPSRSQFSGIYQDIYNEARQELFLYICQNIDKYEPERANVMAWVNFLLERRFFKDAIRKFYEHPSVVKVTNTYWENLPQAEEEKDLREILKEFIDLDPEDIFKNEHIEECPQANFQALVQRRIWGKSWKEIAAEFEIKISTVSSFYYRCINKFSSQLKEYCDR